MGYLIIGSLTLLAFASRLHQLDHHSLWYDELLELDIAQGETSQIIPQLGRHAAMPLDYFILHGWIGLGRHDFWVRLPATFAGTLATPLIYLFATALFNRHVGYVAATLLTLNAFAIRYSQETRPYALLLLMILMAYCGLWQAYRTQRLRDWAMLIFGMVGATLTHYFSLVAFIPLILFVVGQQLYHWRKADVWRRSGLFIGCLILAGLALMIGGRPQAVYSVSTRFTSALAEPESFTQPASEKPNRGSGPDVDLTFFINSMVTPLTSTSDWLKIAYLSLLLLAVLSLLTPQTNHRTAIILMVGWLFIPCLLIYLLLLHRGTFFAQRYIIHVLPANLILVSYALVWSSRNICRLLLRGNAPQIAWGLLVIMLSPLIYTEIDEVMTYQFSDSYEDWRAVATMLEANATPDDAVMAIRTESTMNWYYPARTFPLNTFNQQTAIQEQLWHHNRRWFVLSSYSRKRDQSIREWLTDHGAVLIAIDRRVIVYFHESGLSHAEHLAKVKQFKLPQKAHTYGLLAVQFERAGDQATSRTLYEQAIRLAKNEVDQQAYQTRLNSLK